MNTRRQKKADRKTASRKERNYRKYQKKNNKTILQNQEYAKKML